MLHYNQFIPQAAKLTKLHFFQVCSHHPQWPLPPAAQDKPHSWGRTAHSPSWRENNFIPFWYQVNTALFVNKSSFSLPWDCTMILKVCCHLKVNCMYVHVFAYTLCAHSRVTMSTVSQSIIHTNDSTLRHCSKPSPIITVFLQITSILVFQPYN